MNPKGNFQFSVGGSSILMIFVVLCLTTFGILSYSTADADCKITNKNAETVQSYYQACGNAEKKLKQIDSALAEAGSDAGKAADSGKAEGLKDQALYRHLSKAGAVCKSSIAKDEKCALCYRIFAEDLVLNCGNVNFETDPERDTMSCSFSVDAGNNRQIRVKLKINPYGSSARYQTVSEKLVCTQNSKTDADSGDSLDLWQG